MNKQQQIEEMAVIGCVRNPQAHTAEECSKCDFKQGCCNAYRHAEALYNVGYRKVSDGEAELQELNMKYYKLRRDLDDFDEFARQISKTRIELTGEAVPTCKTLLKHIETEKSKSIKEFAEKLKKVIHEKDYIQGYAKISLIEEIDELLKEYEDGNKNN